MKTYGYWAILSGDSAIADSGGRVPCRCVCGTERLVLLANLKASRSLSCGCMQDRPAKHGHTRKTGGSDGRAPTYNSWRGMMDRCYCQSSISFRNYGARGISVCERWRDFRNFLADMGERPSREHSLDRIDNARGYEPTNCRWATGKEQSRNRRSSKLITALGKTQTIAEWAEQSAIPANRISARLSRGWDSERAVSTPISTLQEAA